jgi:signal peptidase
MGRPDRRAPIRTPTLIRSLRMVGGMALAAACAGLAIATLSFHLEIRPVLTGSMRPTYGPGALLLTKPVAVTSLRRGKIVLFRPPGEHVEIAHRITSVSGPPSAPVITTKGDANKATDPWHAELLTATVPQVMTSVPGVGRLMVGIRGPVQLLLIIAGGLLIGIFGTRWLLQPRTALGAA